jgi:hypothetical protein
MRAALSNRSITNNDNIYLYKYEVLEECKNTDLPFLDACIYKHFIQLFVAFYYAIRPCVFKYFTIYTCDTNVYV